MDTRQDYINQERDRKLTEQVIHCSGYWVTKIDLTQDCRALMPRADWIYPVEVKPLRKPTKALGGPQ